MSTLFFCFALLFYKYLNTYFEQIILKMLLKHVLIIHIPFPICNFNKRVNTHEILHTLNVYNTTQNYFNTHIQSHKRISHYDLHSIAAYTYINAHLVNTLYCRLFFVLNSYCRVSVSSISMFSK